MWTITIVRHDISYVVDGTQHHENSHDHILEFHAETSCIRAGDNVIDGERCGIVVHESIASEITFDTKHGLETNRRAGGRRAWSRPPLMQRRGSTIMSSYSLAPLHLRLGAGPRRVAASWGGWGEGRIQHLDRVQYTILQAVSRRRDSHERHGLDCSRGFSDDVHMGPTTWQCLDHV